MLKHDYVNYHRKICKHYYNEIFEYLKDNTKLPNRIINNKNNKSKIRSKRLK